VALFMREVLPVMRKQKSGNIINVTSIAARNGGGGGAVLYAGTKGFVSTVTRGWATKSPRGGRTRGSSWILDRSAPPSRTTRRISRIGWSRGRT